MAQTENVSKVQNNSQNSTVIPNPDSALHNLVSQIKEVVGHNIAVADARKIDSPIRVGTDGYGNTVVPGATVVQGNRQYAPGVFIIEPERKKTEPTQPASLSLPAESVAANKNGSVKGDPHFVGFDGSHFDFQGHPGGKYLLLEDRGFRLAALFSQSNNSTTVMTQIGGTVNGRKFHIGVNGTPTIDDVAMKQGEEINLGNGSIQWDGKALHIKNGEYDMEIKRQEGHLDVSGKTGDNGVLADGQAPTGILGQTALKDKNQRKSNASFEIKDLFTDSQQPVKKTNAITPV